MKVRIGQRRIRFSLTGNGFRYDDVEEAMNEIDLAVSSIFGIPESSLTRYYYYYRISSEPFCYLELYFEMDVGLWKGRKCMGVLNQDHEVLAQDIIKRINRDVFIDIAPDVYSRQDYLLIMVLCVLVGVLSLSTIAALYVLFRKVMKERRENLLLMC